tara:strand:+ start:1237 stop:1488 length:252 start_codon:yes stop_codon:yes gene_type:complete
MLNIILTVLIVIWICIGFFVSLYTTISYYDPMPGEKVPKKKKFIFLLLVLLPGSLFGIIMVIGIEMCIAISPMFDKLDKWYHK